MDQKQKIQIGTGILKALVAAANRNRSKRTPDAGKQNTNVASDCCARSNHSK
jgi:hypothetical protein